MANGLHVAEHHDVVGIDPEHIEFLHSCMDMNRDPVRQVILWCSWIATFISP
jgi:hypothetical protein